MLHTSCKATPVIPIAVIRGPGFTCPGKLKGNKHKKYNVYCFKPRIISLYTCVYSAGFKNNNLLPAQAGLMVLP
jgi:hypothetical protein